MTDAAGRATTITYNAGAQPLTVNNALGQTVTVAYTGAYPTSVTGDLPGDTTTLSYDGYGRPRTVTASDGYSVTYEYDALNRPTKVTYPDNTFEHVTYDKLDISAFRDRKGRVTTNYDASRRLKSICDPLGRVTTYTWCECGTLDALTDGNGNTTSWVDHDVGRVTREVRAGMPDTVYTYDLAGRLATITDPKGQITNLAYNIDNTLQQVSYTNTTSATGTVNWTYDPTFRRVTSRTEDAGTTTYSYNAVGVDGALDLAAVDGPFAADTVVDHYDELGRRTSRTLNSVTVTQTFDSLGRPDVLTSPVGTFTPAYVGTTGRLASLTYPNGQTSIYSYLPVAQDLRLQTIPRQGAGRGHAVEVRLRLRRGRQHPDLAAGAHRSDALPLRVHARRGGPAEDRRARELDAVPVTLGRQAWDYDKGGNRTVAQADDAVFRTTHDPLNRMQQRLPGGPIAFVGTTNEPATVTVASQPATTDATNTFRGTAATTAGTTTVAVTATDSSGNATTKQYEVDVAGLTTSYTYDPNGNLTSDGVKTYTWNARNQLVRVQQGGADLAVFHVRRRGGRRTTKAAVVCTRTYVYDGPDVLEERVSSGDVVRYVHGPGIDNVLARTTNGANPIDYVADHLGSIVHETNATEATTAHREYDPWGS